MNVARLNFGPSPRQTQLKRTLLTASVTFIIGPPVRSALIATGAVDVPNHRSSHTAPVPRGGGLACLAGVTAAVEMYPGTASLRDELAILGLATVGLIDDHRGLPPRLRLAAQVISGVVVAPQLPKVLYPVPLFLMPGVVNAVNFMDGINGISAATAIVWGINASTEATAHQATKALAALVTGAGIGFLPHNFPNARLFLGDAGSYLFGGIMAAGLIHNTHTMRTFLRTAAPLFPYAADTGFTLLNRRIHNQRLMAPHRDHIYQRLVHVSGLTHTQVTALHSITSILTSLTTRVHSPRFAIASTMTVLAAYLLLPHSLQRIQGLATQRSISSLIRRVARSGKTPASQDASAANPELTTCD